jgi:hypothetical protein
MANLPELPEWLQQLLPEPQEAHRAYLEADKFVLEAPTGEKQIFDDLESFGKAVHNIEFEVAKEIYKKYGRFLSYPSADGFYHTMILAHSDKIRIKNLKSEYKDFLRNAKKYLKDPDSFFNAYYFIDTHPAFWLNKDLEKFPYFWDTSNHCERISHYVSKDDNNDLVVGLETGCHIKESTHEPYSQNYSNHYHDYRLDVYGKTFEEAFIELARKVNLFYNLDGTEVIPEPEHQQPPWVKKVNDSVEKYKKYQAELKEDKK